MRSVASKISLYGLLFPYLNPLALPFDIQPYVLAATAVLWLFYKKQSIAASISILSALFGLTLQIAFIGFSSRNIVTVLTAVSAVTLGFAIVLPPGLLAQVINRSMNIYMVVGIIQVVIPSIARPLVPRSAGTVADSIRGVTSLTPEPGYFGTIGALFFLYFLSQPPSRERTRQLVRAAFIVVLLAQSATGLLLLTAFHVGSLALLSGKARWKAVAFTGMGAVMLRVLSAVAPRSRLFAAFRLADSLESDGSAISRFEGIYKPFTTMEEFPLGVVRELADTGLGGIAGVTSAVGLFSLPFLLFVILRWTPGGAYRLQKWGSIMALLTAISLSSPLPWIIFSLGTAGTRPRRTSKTGGDLNRASVPF